MASSSYGRGEPNFQPSPVSVHMPVMRSPRVPPREGRYTPIYICVPVEVPDLYRGAVQPGPTVVPRSARVHPLTAPPQGPAAPPQGVDVSHPRCIMVSSRKHHRSVCGTDRTGAGIMLSEPTPPRGMAGRVREPRRWWLGVDPSEWSGPEFFAFSVPPGPARGDGRHLPGIHANPGIRTLAPILQDWRVTSLKLVGQEPLTWDL